MWKRYKAHSLLVQLVPLLQQSIRAPREQWKFIVAVIRSGLVAFGWTRHHTTTASPADSILRVHEAHVSGVLVGKTHRPSKVLQYSTVKL